jgi:hypothetical protein
MAAAKKKALENASAEVLADAPLEELAPVEAAQSIEAVAAPILPEPPAVKAEPIPAPIKVQLPEEQLFGRVLCRIHTGNYVDGKTYGPGETVLIPAHEVPVLAHCMSPVK